MARVFLTHSPEMLRNYYGERAIASLSEFADVIINPTGRVLDAEALTQHAQGCEIVISDRQTPGFAAFFERAPDLVAFLRCAVDIRNVALETASREGILVTRATPGFAASVAELGMGFMIDLARHVSTSVGAYRGGTEPLVRVGRQLAGASVGLIGFGLIAQHLARLARAFGMTVLATDPYKAINEPGVQAATFEEVLARSDFVVCLAVATDETENLVDGAALARMKPTAFFINLSRGNLVDEAALASALDEGRIAGAAMDVGRAADQMPSPGLACRPDVIATPHIGGLTPESIEHQAFATVAQARDLLAGLNPDNALNLAYATRLTRLSRCAG
jgi:D-3-phosphoglycerate dehydrogenase